MLVASAPRRRPFFRFALAAAASAVAIGFLAGWAIVAASGVAAMTQGVEDGSSVAAAIPMLLIAVFFGGGIALFFAFLGLLPAAAWAVSVGLLGRRLFNGRASVWAGLLYGLGFAAPALWLVQGLEPAGSAGGPVDFRPPLLIATLLGGPLAGAVLASLTHRTDS